MLFRHESTVSPMRPVYGGRAGSLDARSVTSSSKSPSLSEGGRSPSNSPVSMRNPSSALADATSPASEDGGLGEGGLGDAGAMRRHCLPDLLPLSASEHSSYPQTKMQEIEEATSVFENGDCEPCAWHRVGPDRRARLLGGRRPGPARHGAERRAVSVCGSAQRPGVEHWCTHPDSDGGAEDKRGHSLCPRSVGRVCAAAQQPDHHACGATRCLWGRLCHRCAWELSTLFTQRVWST